MWYACITQFLITPERLFLQGAAIEEASDPNWNFCGYAPVFAARRLVDGRGWGIADRNDFTVSYKPFFESSEEPIEVLSVCLIEVIS